jgi:hypothetical protein
MKRLLAAGGVAALFLLHSAGPAAAAPPQITFAAPTANQRFSTPSTNLDVTVSMSNGTLRGDIVVTWSGPAGAPVPAEIRHATGNNAGTVQITRSNQPFPWNGAYAVTVQATGRRSGVFSNPDESHTATQPFVVDAAPAPPTGLTTAVNSARTVTVRWTANTEAQLVGYEVQRQLGSAAWTRVTVTDASTTSVVDDGTTDTGGTYRYRVVVFRSSADAGQLLASGPSDTSIAKVPAPPVTTTTTTTTTVATGSGQTSGSQRSTTRSGTGTSSATGNTGSSGSSKSSSSALLSDAGKVDLSGFSSLLEQARQAGQVPPGTTPTTEPDPGFDEKLPFAARPRGGGDSDDGGDTVVSDQPPVSDDDSGRVQSMAFLAGGLLVTVLVMVLLWVQMQVRRVDVGPPPPPLPPPARPRRQRATPTAWARFHAEPDVEAEKDREPAAVG